MLTPLYLIYKSLPYCSVFCGKCGRKSGECVGGCCVDCFECLEEGCESCGKCCTGLLCYSCNTAKKVSHKAKSDRYDGLPPINDKTIIFESTFGLLPPINKKTIIFESTFGSLPPMNKKTIIFESTYNIE